MQAANWWKRSLVAVVALISSGAVVEAQSIGIHPVKPGETGANQSASTYHYTGSPVKDTHGYILSHIFLQPIYCGDGWGSIYSTSQKLDAYVNYVVNSSFMSALSVYGCNKGSFATGAFFNSALPKYTTSNQVFVNDSDIQGWLNYWVNGGYLDPHHSFVLYFEPGVAINTSFGTSLANGGAFLGYHSAFWALNPDGATYSMCTYLVLPYPGGPNYTSASQNFKSDFDQLTAVSSHEIAETSTDSWPGYGWIETVYKRNSSNQIVQTLAGEEVGDVPLLLNSWNYSKCYCHLGGYLLQKIIARNGTSLLTPSGASAPDSVQATIVAPAMNVISEKLAILGIE